MIYLMNIYFSFGFAAKIGLASMRAMKHSLFQDFTGLFQEQMSSIQSLILLLLEQTNQFTFPTQRNREDSLNSVPLLMNFSSLKETMMNTCKYYFFSSMLRTFIIKL